MPTKPRSRTARDLAPLRRRYKKLLEIFALPGEQELRKVLGNFPAQIKTEPQQERQAQKSPSAGVDVSRQEEPALEGSRCPALRLQLGL
jgi:hypothetical protein